MNLLIVGAGGMLGRNVATQAWQQHSVTALYGGRQGLDITDPVAVNDVVDGGGYDAVINCAAWTDVDGAERDEAAATAVNGIGVGNLATACAQSGTVLIHVSTGAVFHSTGPEPVPEDATPNPVNAYGRSKLAGEQLVQSILPDRGFVVRTSWLYDRWRGRNFVTTMLGLAERLETVDVVVDQWGQPTWTDAVAKQLIRLAEVAQSGAPAGVYHATARGSISWYGLARAVFQLAELDPGRVRPIRMEDHARAAPQAPYDILSHRRWKAAGMNPLRHWFPMLCEAFNKHPGRDEHEPNNL